MFWTAETLFGRSTLCERCALLALNMASFGYVRRPFGSMQEGLSELNARIAAAGVEPLDIEGSEFGICGHCGEDNVAPLREASA